MTSVDELFRKRKLEDPTSSFSRPSNKSAKLARGSSPRSSPSPSLLRHQHRSKSTVVPVKDHTPPPAQNHHNDHNGEDEGLEDVEAGPSLPPPDGEIDEQDEGDDTEGRFFESGISSREKSALNLLANGDVDGDEAADGEAEEQIDLAWLKKTALSFERKINKNAELRAKFETEPLKFIGSEADLDAEIRKLSLLSEHGELYADFVRSGCVASLAGLLAHENSDIAVSACQVLAELTDEDTSVTDAQWKVLADALIKADVVDLLNLLSEPANHDTVGTNAALQQWLVSRVKRPDGSARDQVGQNRLYAAELLAIIVHRSGRSRHSLAEHTDAVDTILQILAPYRTHDPEDRNSDEAEFVQNLFDTLACLVQDDLGARQFIDNQGIELCLLMLRNKGTKTKGGSKSNTSISQSRAVQVLDHAMTASTATSAVTTATALDMCTYFREKDNKDSRETIEHVVGILASLLRSTPAGSAARIRTLAKFVEQDHAKIVRLLRLRRVYRQRLAAVDAQIAAAKKQRRRKRQGHDLDQDEADELDWLSTRLDAGLFVLNTLDLVLAWLVAEDDVARNKISLALEEDEQLTAGTGLVVLRKSLQDQLDGMNEDASSDTDARDILQALLKCL
ncbi:hypothetical protein DV735_g2153, partial [Chaetothyriales sp. CBS 134920]